MVGGPHGVSAELAARVQQRWSLSRLTLTHEMARAGFVEQIYRCLHDHSWIALSKVIGKLITL